MRVSEPVLIGPVAPLRRKRDRRRQDKIMARKLRELIDAGFDILMVHGYAIREGAGDD